MTDIDRKINISRIEWCDVFKGLLIISMVLGHATGKYNAYIYQFHMAAFFIISGYTTRNLDKKTLIQVVVEKFYRLMVPYYFLGICGISLFYLLAKIDILSFVSTIEVTVSYFDALKLFLRYETLYCDWLGAIWFLPVLFKASIIVKLVTMFSKQNKVLFLAISGMLFILTEYYLSIGIWNIWILSFLAQFYIAVGILMNRGERENNTITLLGLLIVVGAMWYFSVTKLVPNTVDWPSRKFNGALIDVYLPVWGTLFVMILAKLLCKTVHLKQLLQYVGKNTISILCFHFIGFKVAYVALLAVHLVDFGELYCLTPGASGTNWYPVYVFIAIAFSLLVWNILCKVKAINILLGCWKGKIYSIFSATSIGKAVNYCYYFFVDCFSNVFMKHRAKMKVTNLILVSIVLVYLLNFTYGNIIISFPDTTGRISYAYGWQPQSNDENYRFVEQKSEFKLFLGNQNIMVIQGYIPEDIEGMSDIKIYVNDQLAFADNVQSGSLIDYKLDLGQELKKYQINAISFEFNGVKIPNSEDADKRTMSALINKIEFYKENILRE